MENKEKIIHFYISYILQYNCKKIEYNNSIFSCTCFNYILNQDVVISYNENDFNRIEKKLRKIKDEINILFDEKN